MFYDGILVLCSFSYSYIMEKLTYLETLEAERLEKIKAKKQARQQERQRQKRLWYLPIVCDYLVFVFILLSMYFLVFSAWYITGEAHKDCPMISYPVVKQVCELAKTGAEE